MPVPKEQPLLRPEAENPNQTLGLCTDPHWHDNSLVGVSEKRRGQVGISVIHVY